MALPILLTLSTEVLIKLFVESEDIMNLALTCRTLYTVWEKHKEVIIPRQTPCYNAGRDLAIIQYALASSTTMDKLHALRSKKLSQQPSLINIIHANTADATALITAIEHSLLPKRLICTRPSCRDRSTTLTPKEKECITLAHHLLRAYVLLASRIWCRIIRPIRDAFEALIASLGLRELELLREVFLFITESTSRNDDGERGRERNGFAMSDEGVSHHLYDKSDKNRRWLACMSVFSNLSHLLIDAGDALCDCQSEAMLGGKEVLLPTSFLDKCLE